MSKEEKEQIPLWVPKGTKNKIYKKIKDRRGMTKYINSLIYNDLTPPFN